MIADWRLDCRLKMEDRRTEDRRSDRRLKIEDRRIVD